MNPTSKTLPFIAVLGAASLLAMPVALAQAPRSGGDDWPARPVRFIVPLHRARRTISSRVRSARSWPISGARASWSTTVRAVAR